MAASAAFFFVSSALAQNAGTVTNHAFAIGKGAGTTGYTSLLCGSAQLAVGQAAADPICRTVTGDWTLSAAGAATLATVNSNVGAFGSATQCTAFTVNAKGLITAASSATCTPAVGSVTGLGTGVATFLATPSSANLRAALTDEVGTGAAYFVGGALGTPASGTATNLIGLPLSGLTTQGAYTFVGNNTGSPATPTAVDIATLTSKASPAASDYVILSDQAASGAWKKATISSIASAGSVSSLNGQTGAITTDLSALQNCSIAASAAGSALTIALKDAAGSDPSAGSACAINFRSATGATGTFSTLAATAANSLVVSSGSTLGVISSTAFRLWVVMFNDAGTLRLGVVNCAISGGVFGLDEGSLVNSTAEGGAGAADNAGTFYTGTAVSSKAFRILGYIEWSASGLTAGTWTTTNLSVIQSFGPGIKKPGDLVQEHNSQVASTVQSSSTSYVDTGVTAATIAPKSAANLFKVSGSGALGSASLTNISVAFFRTIGGGAASQVTTSPGTANFYARPPDTSSMLMFSGGQTDAPNTTSTLAYYLYWKDNLGVQHDLGRRDADTIFVIPTSITVQEIMR